MSRTEIAVAVLLVVMVALVLYVQRPPEEPDSLPVAEAPPASEAPAPAAEPEIRYPVAPPEPQAPAETAAPPAAEATPEAAAPEQVPLAAEPSAETDVPAAEPAGPTLDTSDAPLIAELKPVIDLPANPGLFYTNHLVRRLVVTVDNLTRRQYPRANYRVARSVPGQLAVRRVRIYQGDEEKLYLSPDNYARYTPFVELFGGLNSQRLVMIYRHFYPLFQEAYAELGYPSAYFNDRLVDVIDHLLATPDVKGEIKLVRPHVLFKYADPELEALSAGQKVLIRVGPANATRLKAKLRELRQLLTGQSDDSAG